MSNEYDTRFGTPTLSGVLSPLGPLLALFNPPPPTHPHTSVFALTNLPNRYLFGLFVLRYESVIVCSRHLLQSVNKIEVPVGGCRKYIAGKGGLGSSRVEVEVGILSLAISLSLIKCILYLKELKEPSGYLEEGYSR